MYKKNIFIIVLNRTECIPIRSFIIFNHMSYYNNDLLITSMTTDLLPVNQNYNKTLKRDWQSAALFQHYLDSVCVILVIGQCSRTVSPSWLGKPIVK